MKERTIHPLWSWQEERVIERYADELVAGRLVFANQVVEDVRRELDAVHAENPDEPWARAPRTPLAVIGRLRRRALELGARWSSTDWHPLEHEAAVRHTRAFLSGKYRDLVAASRACCDVLLQLAESRPGRKRVVSNRTGTAVYRYMLKLAREMGSTLGRYRWSKQEMAIVRRFARDVVKGRQRSVRAAARDCVREFERLRSGPNLPAWLAPPRTWVTVRDRIYAEARAQRPAPVLKRWGGEEHGMLDDFARQDIAGTYRTAGAAAAEYIRARRERGLPQERTLCAVRARIAIRAARLGRHVPRRFLTPSEETLLQPYVDDVVAGRYRTATEAAQAFGRDCGENVGIGFVTALLRIRGRLAGGKNPFRWNPAETAVRDRWVDWYLERRKVARHTAHDEAAAGMHRELARVGPGRSLCSCHEQIFRQGRLRRMPKEEERSYLADCLERAGGNVRQAAKLAGFSPSYVYLLMKQYGLPYGQRPGPVRAAKKQPGRGLPATVAEKSSRQSR